MANLEVKTLSKIVALLEKLEEEEGPDAKARVLTYVNNVKPHKPTAPK